MVLRGPGTGDGLGMRAGNRYLTQIGSALGCAPLRESIYFTAPIPVQDFILVPS